MSDFNSEMVSDAHYLMENMAMLRSIQKLYGYKIHATDGNIGEVYDFYFDDQFWVIRYLVVETGGWLSGRRVLISSSAMKQPDWEKRIFPVSLTREQVRKSPSTNMHLPISRQHERELHEHYGLPPYWKHDFLNYEMGTAEAEYAVMAEIQQEVEEEEAMAEVEKREEEIIEEEEDSHLQSLEDVTGYHIHATDGQIGHLDDLIVDDENWAIRYMAVDTRNWLPGKKVLVSPHWIEKVSWADSEVYVDLSRETVRNSPEFDHNAPVNRDYEDRLHDYYGRRKYWAEDLHKGRSKR
jgi:stress response protein YsnF